MGERGGETVIFNKDGSLRKAFTDKFKTSLGPKAEKIISEEDTALREERQRLREAEKQLKESEGIDTERQKKQMRCKTFRDKIGKVQTKIDALTVEQGSNLEAQNKVNDLKTLKKTTTTILFHY